MLLRGSDEIGAGEEIGKVQPVDIQRIDRNVVAVDTLVVPRRARAHITTMWSILQVAAAGAVLPAPPMGRALERQAIGGRTVSVRAFTKARARWRNIGQHPVNEFHPPEILRDDFIRPVEQREISGYVRVDHRQRIGSRAPGPFDQETARLLLGPSTDLLDDVEMQEAFSGNSIGPLLFENVTLRSAERAGVTMIAATTVTKYEHGFHNVALSRFATVSCKGMV